MNTRLTLKLALAMLLALLAPPSIRAGTITLGNLLTTGTDAATGISTANTYVCCLAFGTNGNVNINSVPFQQVHPGGVAPPFNGTDTTHGGTYSLQANHNLNSTANANAASQADGNTRAMLGDVVFVQSAAPVGSDLNQTYGGLTAGSNYTLRIYYRQWVSPDNRSINVFFNGEGTLEAYAGNPFNESVGGAHYLEYDFKAASTSVNVYMTNLVANESVMISGMSLQWVPPTPVAPTIGSQPVGFTNWAGINISLSVSASGTPAPAYQWYQNSLPLAGATTAVLSFSPLDPTNAGAYFVVVTNIAPPVVTSSVVSVRVIVGTNVISPKLSQVQLPTLNTDTVTGIDPGSNYLCVLDFGPSAFSGQVNGVTFTPVNLVTTQSGTDPNYGGTWTASTIDVNGFKSVAGGGANPIPGQADGNMASVLAGANYLGVAPVATTATFNFGGLALGAKYELRYYYQQWIVDSPLRLVQFTFNGDGTNAIFQTDEDIGRAYYIEYDFTATGSAVSLLLTDESSVANYGPMIYAMTLQQTAAAPAPVAPTISSQPVGFTNWAGFSASLSVTASGSPAPAYQWYQNGTAVPGDTNSLIAFSPLDPTNAGSYYVIITNSAGSVTSSVVSVRVLVGTNVISPTLSQVKLPATGTDAATGIGTGTNYLCALDFGISAYPGTVNGITFTPVNLSGTNQSGTDPNYGGSWTASTTDTNGFKDVANGSPANVNTQADGVMAQVLAGASYLGVAPVATAASFDFGGLAAGGKYSLRFYYRQWEVASPRPVQFTFNGDGTDAIFQTDEDLGGAYYMAYAFTAAGTNVSMVLTDESGVINYGPMIYAITLQQTAAATAPVILNYSLSGTSLTLFWDAGITGYVLESTAQLPATSWTPVPGVVNNSVMVSAATGSRFFRLHKQ
jgi:Immunoglobulin domain